jgi:hypothetical protein
MARHRLPARLFNAMQQDELVNLSHAATVATSYTQRQLGFWWRGLFGN